MTGYLITFTEPPTVGETLTLGGKTITVARTCNYTRRNGSLSYLVEWRHQDGRVGVSGLVARDVRWGQTIDEALRLSAEARARRAAQGGEAETSAPQPRQAKPPAPPKARISLRIDPDVAARLKAQGDISEFANAAIKAALDRLSDGRPGCIATEERARLAPEAEGRGARS